jgi:hypothetical protein
MITHKHTQVILDTQPTVVFKEYAETILAIITIVVGVVSILKVIHS